MSRRPLILPVVVSLLALLPYSVRACAACYGQSDSPMAAGMNWGIISLLGMIVAVLGGVAGFFIFLARRSAVLAQTQTSGQVAQTWDASWPTIEPPENVESIALARGGFRRNSSLARQRKNCAHPGFEPARPSGPRGSRS